MSDPKPFLCALALTLAAAGAAPVQASSPDSLSAQVKHCASLTDASVRLACYDALAGSPAPAASTAGSAATPVAASARTASAPAASTSATAATAAVAATAGVTAVNGATAPGASPAPSNTEFGVHNGPLEAQRIAPQREKRLLAVVSGVSNRPRGELVVTLDNGQVWVQLEAKNYPLKAGDHVEIDVGAMGSYVLWCPSNRRATKVTRIS
jgi:hypothetical protein